MVRRRRHRHLPEPICQRLDRPRCWLPLESDLRWQLGAGGERGRVHLSHSAGVVNLLRRVLAETTVSHGLKPLPDGASTLSATQARHGATGPQGLPIFYR